LSKDLSGEKVLLTGGAGFIGSHTALVLSERGADVVVVDDFSNSCPEAIRRVQELTGKSIVCEELDVRDQAGLERIMKAHKPHSVIHFAGLKAVGESVCDPQLYFDVNLGTTSSLLGAMQSCRMDKLIFSSSATVYGDKNLPPLNETMPTPIEGAQNPYGLSKLMIEQILRWQQMAHPSWSVTSLRYFNPVGAHPSGRIGEDPTGDPSNLMPRVTRAALGILDCLHVFGTDYPQTPDGSASRDYIHVMDLAEGHAAALQSMLANRAQPELRTYNLGSGRATTVLELLAAFEEATGVEVKREIHPRRAGDLAVSFADPSKANRELDWKTQRTIVDMCRDAWNWQKQNPKGYQS
jgi:UDP-glucose 4-epimerase